MKNKNWYRTLIVVSLVFISISGISALVDSCEEQEKIIKPLPEVHTKVSGDAPAANNTIDVGTTLFIEGNVIQDGGQTIIQGIGVFVTKLFLQQQQKLTNQAVLHPLLMILK